MTPTIDRKNLEQKLIRGFALADAWFDFVHDGMAFMDIGERILAILGKLQRMLKRIKPLPIHENEVPVDCVTDDEVSQYFNTLYVEELVAEATDPEVRDQLRDHLYYCLVLLELESTQGLQGRMVTLPDGQLLTVPQYVRLVVFTVESMLAELNGDALQKS
jgi:hypothetical protein